MEEESVPQGAEDPAKETEEKQPVRIEEHEDSVLSGSQDRTCFREKLLNFSDIHVRQDLRSNP